MATPATIAIKDQHPEAKRWSRGARMAFRFCLIYFGLYCLSNQIVESLIPIPNLDIPDPAAFWPLHQMVAWTAVHVFRVTSPLVITGSGSGDKTFDWVLDFCLLIIAAMAAIAWSLLDRKRENYSALYKWARLALRFALAGQMMTYGLSKVVPLQMPFPYLRELLEPFGNFSPMGILWSAIGAAPGYEVFAGCAETLAGVLLLIPATTTLGALICVVDMTQVFMLNMTYDVPVKLLSFQLLLMALLLLAPDFKGIANFLVMHRAAAPCAEPELFRTPRANRISVAAQLGFGLLLLAINAYGSWTGWHQYGGGRAKSPLYGVWDVTAMSISGQVRAPLFNDWARWRRAIFDFPQVVWFQRPDDSFASYHVSIDSKRNKMSLTGSKGELTYQRRGNNGLILDGPIEGKQIHMELRLIDRNQLLLVNRGFHWIQEYPFNR